MDDAMEKDIQILGLEAPRITPADIEAVMRRVTYRTSQPEDTTSTFVHAFLDNRFYLATGYTACVSKENFNAALGEKYARQGAEKKAADKLWELEGYVLYRQEVLAPKDRIERMSLELADLESNLTKLKAFTGTPQFEALEEVERIDLLEQAQCMLDYRGVLLRRLTRATAAAQP